MNEKIVLKFSRYSMSSLPKIPFNRGPDVLPWETEKEYYERAQKNNVAVANS
jgi:hypothetical protein